MPNEMQQTILDVTLIPLSDGTFGHSNKKSLSRSFPSAIHHSDGPTTRIDGQSVDLDEASYKKAYAENVMSGIKNLPGGKVDMDYGTQTDDLAKQPPKEIFDNDFTHPSNTIAKGGLGPTSTTLDIDNVKEPGTNRPLVEAGSVDGAAFVSPSETEPFASSKKISSGGVHGGATADESGIPGSSVASLGS